MPTKPAMVLTYDLYRPFGSGAPLYTAQPCDWVPALFGGEEGVGPNAPKWDCWIDVPATADIRDGCTRSVGSNNWNVADGDEIRIRHPNTPAPNSYVCVFVMWRYPGYAYQYKRAYLMRHVMVWPSNF